jgi:hypothetical protein
VWGSFPRTLAFPYHTTPPMLHTHSPIYQHYSINSAILTNCLLLHGNLCHRLKCIWINHHYQHHHHHHQLLLNFRSINPLVPKLNSQCNLRVFPWTGTLKHVMTYMYSPS